MIIGKYDSMKYKRVIQSFDYDVKIDSSFYEKKKKKKYLLLIDFLYAGELFSNGLQIYQYKYTNR